MRFVSIVVVFANVMVHGISPVKGHGLDDFASGHYLNIRAWSPAQAAGVYVKGICTEQLHIEVDVMPAGKGQAGSVQGGCESKVRGGGTGQ